MYATTLAVLALAAPAAAAPGDLDPSFAGTGLIAQQLGDNTGDGDSGQAIAAQPDGKIVVVGHAANSGHLAGGIARYLAGGTLDPSFGSGGKIIDTTFVPEAVAVQPDGRIVAVGEADGGGGNSAYAFARYLPNGALDPSFGGGTGKVNVLVNATDNQQEARAVAITPDGKIVAAGLTKDGAALVRLNSDGTPDSTFAGDGSVKFLFPSTNGAQGVAVQADGSVVAAVPMDPKFTLVRVDSHGMPDSSFGSSGVLSFSVGTDAQSNAVAIQPDGKILVGGEAQVGSGPREFAIARLNPNGSPDPSFAGGAPEMTVVAPNSLNADGEALVLQPNGRIVLAGEADLNMNSATMAWVRYDGTDGALDPTFGTGGVQLQPFPAGWGTEFTRGAALACDGKILSVGGAAVTPTAHGSFLISRILGDPIPCPGLNPPPVPLPGSPDHVKPHSHIRRVPHVIRASKLKWFAGTASDNSGVAKVEIALLRRVGKTAAFSRRRASCLWLRSNRAKFKTLKPKRGRCATARFLRAKGTTKWVFKLRRHLAPGSYILYARATDQSGNRETRFSSKLGNRASFRVIAG
jgi:uncharacterized delta-60 repeat protein